MPSFSATYKYSDLVGLADNMVSGIATSGIDTMACDWIDSIFWNWQYPWRWATAFFTPINLADSQQDFAVTDTNVMEPLSGRIVRTDTTTVDPKDVGFSKWIEPSATGGSKVQFPNFSTVAYLDIADSNKIRMPAMLSIPSGQTLQFQGEYKKNHTKLTATSGPIVFPDHHINTFISGLIWVYYKFTKDKRQGTLQIVEGRAVYTGAFGEFMDSLINAAQIEDFGKSETRFPDEALGANSNNAVISIYGAF